MSNIYSCDNCKHKDKVDGSCKGCIASYNTETKEHGKPTHFERKDLPKICEILGVEVGEEFTFPYPNRTYDRVFVKKNGQVWERVDRTGNTHKLGGAAVCWLINHADSIKKYQMLTEKETEMCRAIGAKWVSRGTAADIDVCFVKLWAEKPELCKSQYFHMGGFIGKIVVDLFPSVCPGSCIEVPHD